MKRNRFLGLFASCLVAAPLLFGSLVGCASADDPREGDEMESFEEAALDGADEAHLADEFPPASELSGDPADLVDHFLDTPEDDNSIISEDTDTASADDVSVTAAAAAKPLLRAGLHQKASDALRKVGVAASRITQTIGNASASAGTHKADGTANGKKYCAATDISVRNLSDAQVKTLVSKLDSAGFAAFFRNPGKDGWPANQARHIHAVFAGVKMKASLRAQVQDFLVDKNGLASHGPYKFYKATKAQKDNVRKIFNAAN
ncbi:hypothetical protein LZC95_37100 [Pendulispora brunnea]|uniref:Uncharacterized protein n=1 Tax=Pendulispora brunnea TaxID=2905690 RepID=A0ABZ2JZZ2_9BACT